MGEELNRSLRLLAERGTERGAAAVLDEARSAAAAEPDGGRPSWQRGLVVAFGAAIVVFFLIGVAILMARPFGGEEIPAATKPLVTPTAPRVPLSIVPAGGSLNDVNDLALAPDGVLWAATPAGLVRWDTAAREFELFTESDGVPGRSLDTVAVAPDGTVWVLGDHGIGRYDGSWHIFSEQNTPELAGQVGALAVDHDGVVWVAVASEPLARYDGSWSSVAVPDDMGMAVTAFAFDLEGTLWVGTDGRGVYSFNGSVWRRFGEADGAPSRARHVATAPDGSVWAWSDGYYTDSELSTYVPGTGFSRYDGGAWTTYTVDDGLLSDEGDVVVAGDGTVVVVHERLGPNHEPVWIGVSQFDGAEWAVLADDDIKLYGPIAGVAVGANGTVWIPTESGIVGSDGIDIVELTVPEELATPPIAPFAASPDPEADVIQVSTETLSLEFTPLRTPGQVVVDTEITPFGWMALGDDVVWQSNDGLTWNPVLAVAESSWMMADGSDLVIYEWGLARYSWDGAGWVEVAAAELPGRIQGLAFGPNGAVALVDNKIYYSTDGVAFVPAETGPSPVQVDDEQSDECSGWWQEMSVAGPGSGPILVTETGYVLLAPADGNWDALPICGPLAWFSPDGNRWELLTPQSPFEDSAVADIAAYADRFVSIGGNDVWVSDDGVDWQRAEVPQLGMATALAAGDLGWFLVGDSNGSDQSGPAADMWLSADGLKWDGPYKGPEGLGYAYFHIEPTVGSDAIISVNGTHDGFVVGRLRE